MYRGGGIVTLWRFYYCILLNSVREWPVGMLAILSNSKQENSSAHST